MYIGYDTTIYCQSNYCLVDWLIYHDDTIRVCRSPHDLYDFHITLVPTLILRDKFRGNVTSLTQNFTNGKLIPSKIMKTTIYHISNTLSTDKNRTKIKQNIFLLYVHLPYYINSASPPKIASQTQKKDILHIMVLITGQVLNPMYRTQLIF